MRLIDKDELLSDIERTIEESGCVNHEDEIMDCVWYASDVDAVPVVRCKDCAHGRYDDDRNEQDLQRGLLRGDEKDSR